MWPDKTNGKDIYPACFLHDLKYWAGYPMKTTKDGAKLVELIELEAGGIDRLKLIHLNDSKGKAGGHLDRHEHIGKGNIGAAAFKAFLNSKSVKGLPMILETPKTDEKSDPKNLKKVSGLLNIV